MTAHPPSWRTSIDTTLKDAATALTVSESPRLDTELLLAEVLGKSRTWLYAHSDEMPAPDAIRRFTELIRRRASGEPVAYLTGNRAFWKHSFRVTPDVLIPRPETECLIELVLANTSPGPALALDLGTGSGAIAISLAAERPDWQVIGTDLSNAALELAADNARLNEVAVHGWARGIWTRSMRPASVNLIVANPPYIAAGDPHLDALRFEPQGALLAGADGLADLSEIIRDAARVLTRGGSLFLEHGHDQQPMVLNMMRSAGFNDAEGMNDYNGTPRAAFGELHP
jgi:release factor glutamine methyltransferase